MSEAEAIGSVEVILRRIPPSTIDLDSTKSRHPEPGYRATSPRLSTKPGEQGLSCSRLRQTSPQELLNQLSQDEIDPEGWLVCRIRVQDVLALGLEVIHVPIDGRDSGHCEIRGKNGLDFPNAKSSKLARKSRILTAEEVSSLHAGDALET